MAGKRLRNIHPGELLVEKFLKPLGVSQYRLAKDIGVPLTRIVAICKNRRAITADTALRLARYFGTSAKFWLGLQEDFDLEEQSQKNARELMPSSRCPPDPFTNHGEHGDGPTGDGGGRDEV